MTFICAWLAGQRVTTGSSSIVTIENLIAAILETKTFTPAEIEELDLNDDGWVDVADLAKLLSAGANGARFAAGTTIVDEGAGTVNLQLKFDPPLVNCPVTYTVLGSAESNVDFQPLTGVVMVNGATATIPVTIIDDTTPDEGTKLLIVKLAQGPCYERGGQLQHTLTIVDNDVLRFGSLITANGRVGFQMRLTHSPTGWTGKLISDGKGTFPAGEYDADVSYDSTTFSAVTVPVSFPAGSSSLGTAFSRTLDLQAAAGDPSHPGELVTGDLIKGHFTETIAFEGGSLPSTEITGTFVLLRPPAGLPSWTPPLTPVPTPTPTP